VKKELRKIKDEMRKQKIIGRSQELSPFSDLYKEVKP